MDEDLREEERVRQKFELGRLASDLHSEKRGRERMLDRLAQIERSLDRIEQDRERVKWTLDRIITIAATVTMIILEILKNK